MSKKYSYDEETAQKCIELYNQGVKIKDIAELIGGSVMTLYRLFNRNNVVLNRNVITPNYNDETKQLYNELFIQNKYIPYLEIDTNKYNYKYKYDTNYFNCIDNQDKAYILGLLYADGNMTKDFYRVSITLQEKDIDILLKINHLIKSNRPLELVKTKNSNWQNGYKLVIYDHQMINALYYHGLVPAKSLIVDFPLNFPSQYYRDFIRGYFDGNGTINAINHSVSITSTIMFLEKMKLYIENELHINCYFARTDTKQSVIKALNIGGRNQSAIFLEWLYKDANLFLERKYQKYLNAYMDKSLLA